MPAGEEHHGDAPAPGGYHIRAILARRHIPSLAPQSLPWHPAPSHRSEAKSPERAAFVVRDSPGFITNTQHKQQVMLALHWQESMSPSETTPHFPSPTCWTWAAGQREKKLYTDTAPQSFMRWAATSSSASKTNLVNHSEVSVKTKSRQTPWILERQLNRMPGKLLLL